MIAVVARFLASGVLNTLSTLLLYWLLLALLSPQAAYAVSFAIGVILSYVLNLRFVFRERHSTKKVLLFPLVYLATYALGAGVLQVAIHRLSVPAAVAPLLSIVCTLPVSFLLIRWLLANRASPAPTPTPTPTPNHHDSSSLK